ncbi:MAG: LamG-like jellyroll fold domain-containing protein, partial [Planctomycetota bacterium]
MDFDGDPGSGNLAYDTDGDASTFSQSEVDAITLAHGRLSEYYAAFDIDVTTEQPADLSATPTAWASIRSNSAGSAYAYVGTFPNSASGGPQAFIGQDFLGYELDNAIAHEVGHVFGLGHQHGFNLFGEETQEYRTDAYEGPILGGFSGVIHQFVLGHAHNPAALQDDVAGIAAELVAQGSSDGFRADDHGGSLLTPTTGATALTANAGAFAAEGIIERLSDVDAYAFAWTGGVVQLDVSGKGVSSLNPVVHVYDASGVLVGFDEPDSRTDQDVSVTMNLAGGTYYALVSGWGDYGDFGVYTLNAAAGSGTPAAPVTPDAGVVLGVDAANLGTGQVGLTWGAVPGATGYLVERSEDGVTYSAASGALGSGVTSYLDTGLSAGKTYVYRLTAQGAGTGGADLYSAPLALATLPGAVTDLRVMSLSADTLVVDWRDVHGDNGYRIERSTDGTTFTQVGTVGANVNSFTDSGLSSGTLYHYRVTSLSPVAGSGDGGAATSVAFTRTAGLQASVVGGDVVLQWTDGAGETGYEVQRRAGGSGSFTTLATLAADATTYTDTTGAALTEYEYRVVAQSSAQPGAPARSAVDVLVALPGVLPGVPGVPGGAWTGQDIGSVGGIGAAGESGGTFTVVASGRDIWAVNDEFHFVHQTLVGDGEIVARVATAEHVDDWTKVGLMIRSSLETDAANFFIGVTHADGNGLISQQRLTQGAATQSQGVGSVVAPQWLRLVRQGDVITSYYSADGQSWTQHQQMDVVMGEAVYIGLATTSHDNSALATATYDNVRVTASAGQWALDEGQGAAAADTTHGHNATLTGGAAWADDPAVGSAIDFNGSDGYLAVGKHDALKFTDSFTVSAWVNADSFGAYEGILGWVHDSGSSESGYSLHLRADGQLEFGLATGTGSNGITYLASGSVHRLTAGQWSHVAASYDGATMRLYLDGAEVATQAKTGPVNWNTEGDDGFEIGRWSDNDETYYFDGRISEA